MNDVNEMFVTRRGTYDEAIWASVTHDYATLPASFAPGEVVLDIGCHIGALCAEAASRGATVIGYEANRENHALATINLHTMPSVTVRFAAVWRSDCPSENLVFSPSRQSDNTGGGSVLFATAEEHWTAFPFEGTSADDIQDPARATRSGALQSVHSVPAVPLDDVLSSLGPVRYLKIDVEGAEFPILLTATRLDLVDEIGGEYHEFTDEQMADLAPSAKVGQERYSAALLRSRLEDVGYRVAMTDRNGHLGLFHARRPR